jgi:hypothetical protein
MNSVEALLAPQTPSPSAMDVLTHKRLDTDRRERMIGPGAVQRSIPFRPMGFKEKFTKNMCVGMGKTRSYQHHLHRGFSCGFEVFVQAQILLFAILSISQLSAQRMRARLRPMYESSVDLNCRANIRLVPHILCVFIPDKRSTLGLH